MVFTSPPCLPSVARSWCELLLNLRFLFYRQPTSSDGRNRAEPAHGFHPRRQERLECGMRPQSVDIVAMRWGVQNRHTRTCTRTHTHTHITLFIQCSGTSSSRERGRCGLPGLGESSEDLSMSGEAVAAAVNGGQVVTQGPCTQSG